MCLKQNKTKTKFAWVGVGHWKKERGENKGRWDSSSDALGPKSAVGSQVFIIFIL